MKKILLSSLVSGVLFSSSAMADDIISSIKVGLFESEKKAMHKVTVSMIQAIEAAKKSVNGQVVKAKLDEEDDYLVYKIKIIARNGKKMEVLVDPVTAKVLKSKDDD
ncbi:PepSY domain-containing protein [Sulfurovum sp.]|uniref:PepSY domain-containing protein n=1 Tax=Sulfurovum sp. TaxID=1969726 RepID=UPI0025FA9C80|nr:PepSY domain-containing protein [Sulfurovum sp.]